MDYKGHKLLYNAAAHFAAMELYEDGIIDAMNKCGSAGLNALCWGIAETSAQAEAYNRYMGKEAKKPLEADELVLTMRPADIIEAKRALIEAVLHGISPKDDPNAEVDEVLAELQKKTESN